MNTEFSISPTMEDYLERIYVASKSKNVVRVKDISKLMDVRMPSVINAINMLKKLNLVTQEPYGYIEITDYGKQIAEKILDKHNVLSAILRFLGVPDDIAEQDACSVEHVISEETFEKLKDHFRKFTPID
ncbi:MAG: metal-dependent transcriptional regulator [Deferribacteraceae bacterium]|jgi:DtxR family Mn-dependent transcriptional regulator|nr:metal-dependent transcriptional regulator [Deferribacteraceae bacterium]